MSEIKEWGAGVERNTRLAKAITVEAGWPVPGNSHCSLNFSVCVKGKHTPREQALGWATEKKRITKGTCVRTRDANGAKYHKIIQ